jgi:hypothetical protein
LLPLQTGFRSDLHWQDGTLFFSNDFSTPRFIEAMPAAGGERRILVEGSFLRLWVEPEQLILFEEGAFYAAPLGGGEARLLLDTGAAQLRYMEVALDEGHFYWTTEGDFVDPAAQVIPRWWTIWRARRDGGGAPEAVAVISTLYDRQILEVLPDGLLVEDVFLTAGASPSVVSKADGSERLLPQPELGSWVQAWSDEEVLWGVRDVPWDFSKPVGLQRVDLASGVAERAPFAEVPMAGGMEAWPTGGDGGWIVAGEERFSDGVHISVWSVEASGRTARLACSPAAEGVARFRSDARAITADAVYGFADHGGVAFPEQPRGWSLVRIARTR